MQSQEICFPSLLLLQFHIVGLFSQNIVTFCRTLLEEYCCARKTLGAEKSEIRNLNESVKDLIQALEKRYS